MIESPYFQDAHVTLYLGDMREILPALGQFDAAIVDPPYRETSLAWDRWPDGWPKLVAEHTNSMWCFGSMRMFMDRSREFAVPGWKLSHDVIGEFEVDTMVWEKHNGTGFAADRFRKVHELCGHFYQGHWRDIFHQAQREAASQRRHARRGDLSITTVTTSRQHTGAIGANVYVEDGTRLVRSVLKAPSVRRGLHPTEKPEQVLAPLVEYAVPVGGLVLDPFAGSGSTLLTARRLGRRAVGIEADEAYCVAAAKRLSISDLFAGEIESPVVHPEVRA